MTDVDLHAAVSVLVVTVAIVIGAHPDVSTTRTVVVTADLHHACVVHLMTTLHHAVAVHQAATMIHTVATHIRQLIRTSTATPDGMTAHHLANFHHVTLATLDAMLDVTTTAVTGEL